MKLLFDQNISHRLVKRLLDLYPDAKQVRELGLENSTDSAIFDYAVKGGFIIVTFDSDFCDINIIKGFHAKVIWLRTGNITTKNIEVILREKSDLIHAFSDGENACLEIM